MENKKSNSTAGIGFTGLLQVAFIVLKLCKIIKWSWWWVLAPTWIGIIVAVVTIAIPLIILHFCRQVRSNRRASPNYTEIPTASSRRRISQNESISRSKARSRPDTPMMPCEGYKG